MKITPSESIKLQSFLIADIKLLAISLFMRNHPRKNPIETVDLQSEFGDLILKLVPQLEDHEILGRRSTRSKQLFLTKLGFEIVSEIVNWGKQLNAKLLDEAELKISTAAPMRISNLNVSQEQVEIHLPTALSCSSYNLFAVKDEPIDYYDSPIKRLFEEIGIFAEAESEKTKFKIPSTDLLKEVAELAAAAKVQKINWRR